MAELKHISKLMKQPVPKKGKATRRKQGTTGARTRKVVVPAVEDYANQNRFVISGIVVRTKSGKKTKTNPDGAGRPPSMTQEVVRKLEDAFCYDSTVEEACLYAGISRQTYYEFIKEYPAFADRVEHLRQAPLLVIRRKLVATAQHDADLGLKYVERKRKMEFSTRSEVAHSGEVINRHHVDPEQAALIKAAMGGFARIAARRVAPDTYEVEEPKQ